VRLVNSQTIAASARTGTAPPNGARNATSSDRVLPPDSIRRRTSTATQHAAYTTSVATLAMIASSSNVPVVARTITIAACATMATCGVLNRSCTRASAPGRYPSRAKANSIRGTASDTPAT
jgi:hypothetical protein